MFKKISTVAVAALVVLALTAVTADAGVGGCRRLGRCGGYEAASDKVVKQTPENPNKPSFLDSLSWILPADIVAAGKAIFDKGQGGRDADVTTEGVGGCRLFGCGSGSGQ